MLLQESISASDSSEASTLLKHFCLQIRSLYGARYQTFNVHNLIHIVKCVYDLGNLWANCCFFYEDYNGDLRSLFHGAQHIDIQILTAISIHQKIPEIVPLLPVDSKAYEFYQKMSFKYHHKMKTHLQEIINERITAVGDLSCFAFQGEQKIKLEELCGPIKKAYKFSRLMIEGRVYHSKSYKRVTKRNSYTICYTNQARQQCFGYARFYVKCFKACRIPGFCDKDCVCRVPKYVVVLDRAIPHIDPTASPKKFPFFCQILSLTRRDNLNLTVVLLRT